MATKKDFKRVNPAMNILNQAQEPITTEPTTKKGTILDMTKTKKAPRNKRMQIMVTEETFTKLHELSEDSNISMNEVINQLLENLLKKP